MRNYERGIYPSILDEFEQRPKVFMNVRLAHLEGEAFRKGGTNGNLSRKPHIGSVLN